MLRNQGHSVKDIYSKGADGRTLLQRTQEANGIKDLKRMRDGHEFHIPKKEGAATTDNAKVGQPSETTVGPLKPRSTPTGTSIWWRL